MRVTEEFRLALVKTLGYRDAQASAVTAICDLVEEWIPKFFLECETITLPCNHPALKPTTQVAVVRCACGRQWHLKAEAGKTWNATELP